MIFEKSLSKRINKNKSVISLVTDRSDRKRTSMNLDRWVLDATDSLSRKCGISRSDLLNLVLIDFLEGVKHKGAYVEKK